MRKTLALSGLAVLLTAGSSIWAQPQDEAAKPETTVDASQGFVTFKSGDNSLTLGAWGQFRATFDDRDEFSADLEPTSSGFGEDDGVSTSLSIPRLRFYLQGTVFKPWLRYRMEVEVANLRTDAVTNINNGRITDGYVEFAKCPHATLRAGQYKVPFGMQELVSDTRQEFVDRSIASVKFAPSRDVGLMLGGQFLEGKKLGYQVGVFNGAGQNNPQDDQSLMYVGRVWFDPFGEYRLVEGAVDNPEKNQLHVGVAYRGGEVPRGLSSVGVFEDPDSETALGVEAAWKYRRFFAMAEYFDQSSEQQNPVPGPDIDASGFHAQFGVFVVPSKQEVAVRYAEIEPDESISDAKQTEIRAVYGYFWRSHNMKLQADFGQITFGENFSTLSTIALRGVSPGLSATQRIVTLPGEELKDLQGRIQFVVAF